MNADATRRSWPGVASPLSLSSRGSRGRRWVAVVGQRRSGLGHELRLIQGIRVALNAIHQLGNLLFGEQVEHEVARQVSESESNARIFQRA